ncbi:hypothetical protein I4U23_000135 [Adineta vaga]|nr:hypothetical protein I4U23_000135 [Adineta vaga]
MATVKEEEKVMAAISKNQMYLDYINQATVGILMNSLRYLCDMKKLTPNQSIAIFFNSENKETSLELMYYLLEKYVQYNCDAFCYAYQNVYIDSNISLKQALDLNGDHYAFSHFNKIFQDSCSNSIPGPKHLGCLIMCTRSHYMPLLFSTILNSHIECTTGALIESHDKNWSEAEQTVVRHMLQVLVDKSIDWINETKQEELKKMPFVCQDENCNENWDLVTFPQDKQVIALENIKKFWNELQQSESSSSS